MSGNKRKIVVLISGRGSNMVAIAESIDAGRIPDAEISLVLSDKPEAPGIEIAKKRSLKTCVLHARSPSTGLKLKRREYDEGLTTLLGSHKVDLICLAGFMRILSPWFVDQFPNQILNIHPSLLPAFTGEDAHRDVIAYGAKVSGCTVHLVDEQVDHGPVVVQKSVPVLEGDTKDTLASRVLQQEHVAYTEAINMVLSGDYHVVGRRKFVKR